MPAVIPSNLHSGFLNEEYGVLLLRQLAAVATVGRAEDHGVDAVATLLPRSNVSLLATDTFLVQFKSQSVDKITYGEPGEGDQEVAWLRNLQMPLFFASISRIESGKPGRLRIFSSQHLMAQLLFNPTFSCIEACFADEGAIPSEADGRDKLDQLITEAESQFSDQQERQTWIDRQYSLYLASLPRTTWWLGEPIVEYDLLDIGDDERRESLISILQMWIRTGYENIERSPLGMFTFLNWKTNQAPVVTRIQSPSREPGPEQVGRIMRIVAHVGMTYLLERLFHGTREDLDAIIDILEGMARDGEDVQLQREFIEENWSRLTNRRETYRKDLGLPL